MFCSLAVPLANPRALSPPPSIGAGCAYRQIFYPDLIDKTQAPSFKIMPDPASADASTCIIRFHAGPPYEVRRAWGLRWGGAAADEPAAPCHRTLLRARQDLAFRIVNREWEQSHRRGFRCTFDRGILYLHFRFKRYRYRK